MFVFGARRVQPHILELEALSTRCATRIVFTAELRSGAWRPCEATVPDARPACAYFDGVHRHAVWCANASENNATPWTLDDDAAYATRYYLGYWETAFANEARVHDHHIGARRPASAAAVTQLLAQGRAWAACLPCSHWTEVLLCHLTGTPLARATDMELPEHAEAPSSLTLARCFVERAWILAGELTLPWRTSAAAATTAVAEDSRYTGGYNAPVIAGRYALPETVVTVLDIISSYPSMFAEFDIDAIPEALVHRQIDAFSGAQADAEAERFLAQHARHEAQPTRPLPRHMLNAMRLRREGRLAPDESQVIKLRINSVYGAFGNARFIYYAPVVAASATLAGRRVIREIHVTAETLLAAHGARVIMGDTDALAVAHRPAPDFARPLLEWMEKRFRHTRLHIDYQLGACWVFAKKHYVGLSLALTTDAAQLAEWDAMTPEARATRMLDPRNAATVIVRGLETRHSTVCAAAKTMMACALWALCRRGAIDDVKVFPDTMVNFFMWHPAWRLDKAHEKAYPVRRGEDATLVRNFAGDIWMARASDSKKLAVEWYLRRQILDPLRRVVLDADGMKHVHAACVAYGWMTPETVPIAPIAAFVMRVRCVRDATHVQTRAPEMAFWTQTCEVAGCEGPIEWVNHQDEQQHAADKLWVEALQHVPPETPLAYAALQQFSHAITPTNTQIVL